MRKLLSSALAIVLASLLIATLLGGCTQQVKLDAAGGSGAAGNAAGGGKISIVATIFPQYDFARAIVGDKAELTMLLPPASESHSFEPTPADIVKIQNCDVFIYVGGESDDWVKGILDSMDTSKMRIITLIDCVEAVEEELVEGMEAEDEGDGGPGAAAEPGTSGQGTSDTPPSAAPDSANTTAEPEYDEHVWTSPRNAKLIVQKISDAVCAADPANASAYKANTTAYLSQLDDLDAKFQDVVDKSVRKTIVLGDRFPFRYLADAYGLQYFAAFPGCSTESDASAKTVAFLIDKVNAEKIPVVFHIELSNQKMANTIAEATGAKVLLLHACHNISKEDFQSGKGYLDLMAANVDALKQALS